MQNIKNSNFDIFESAVYMKSVSRPMPLSIMMFIAFNRGLLKMLRKAWCKDVFKKFLILTHFYSVADYSMR